MFAVAPNARWRAAPPAPGLGRQRLRVRRPDAQCRLHANHVGQTHGGDARAERAVSAVTGVGQQHPGRDAGRKRGPDLIERDLRLGLEDHVVRDMGLLCAALGPPPNPPSDTDDRRSELDPGFRTIG